MAEKESFLGGRAGAWTERLRSGEPFESLHDAKRSQVRRIAALWLTEPSDRPWHEELRFDAVGVLLDRRNELVRLDPVRVRLLAGHRVTVAEEWAARDQRIRVVHTRNGGLGAARNEGLRHVGGDYLAFLDSDDVLPPTAYADLVASLEASGSDFATGSVLRWEPPPPSASKAPPPVPSTPGTCTVDGAAPMARSWATQAGTRF